jgi:hypothetical protein
MARLYNIARMTTSTVGTGTMTLVAAVAGFLSFAGAGIVDGETVSYSIKDGSNSEVGRGVYTAAGTTLTRNILKSTNSNNAIALSGGAEVAISALAEDILTLPMAGGRLTNSTGVPIITSSVTAATTMRYTPYNSRLMPVFDGTSFTLKDFLAELTNDLTASATGKAGPAACVANSNYDLFGWDDAGTMRLTRGPLWTSATARGTGAGTSELEIVQGQPLNKVAITNGPAANRGLYLGSFRTNGSSQVDYKVGGTGAGGVEGFIGIWNMFNRRKVNMQVLDNTATWTYSSATTRQFDGSNTNRVSFISGLAEDGIDAQLNAAATLAATVGAFANVGLALDSTTANDVRSFFQNGTAVAVTMGAAARRAYGPQLGFHYIQALETCDGTSTTTFIGGVNGGLAFDWMA